MLAEVFIIESLRKDDRKAGLLEGEVISTILRMGGRNPLYRFVRTREQFIDAIEEFGACRYRYLHLSCHGNAHSFEFYFGPMRFTEFADLVRRKLQKRRLFVSACQSVNRRLVRLLIPSSGCISIIGPYELIDFDVAAVIWASYYYLAFKNDQTSMKRKMILRRLRKLTKLFKTNLNYYSVSRTKGFKRTRLVGSTRKAT